MNLSEAFIDKLNGVGSAILEPLIGQHFMVCRGMIVSLAENDPLVRRYKDMARLPNERDWRPRLADLLTSIETELDNANLDWQTVEQFSTQPYVGTVDLVNLIEAVGYWKCLIKESN